MVMVAANQRQVGKIREPLVTVPPLEVLRLAPAGGPVTARGDTTPVADGESDPLIRSSEPLLAAQV